MPNSPSASAATSAMEGEVREKARPRRESRYRRSRDRQLRYLASAKGSTRRGTIAFLGTVALAALISSDFKNSMTRCDRRPPPSSRWPSVLTLAAETDGLPRDYLSEDSVVLITGAAGFIGSELAVALHATYNVKKLLCVDSMASGLGNGGPSSSSSRTEAEFRSKVESDGLNAHTEEELALFEFKRQRAFRLLQTAGAKAHFYRSDFRPSIPEYFDVGEVPLLDTIFRTHPDITHVVHLADPYHGAMFDGQGNKRGAGMIQAVPRTKEDTKSGMIEAIFEQLKKVGDEKGRDAIPHLTYASSSEVYYHLAEYLGNPNPPPFREDRNVTVPSSLRGASKLIDEILASAYNDHHGLFSIGLRLFDVYGPWGLPGTPLFEMAERAVSDGESPVIPEGTGPEMGMSEEDVRDYIHLDDVVDGIMAAMQFRPTEGDDDDMAPPNVVVNLGTGKGSTLREAAGIMEQHFPRTVAADEAEDGNNKERGKNAGRGSQTVSYASTDRAEALLGFTPQVTFEDGLANLLAWHYDRAFPYGGRPLLENSEDGDKENNGQSERYGETYVASQGIQSCSPLDRECLRGAPVFPCASECSNPSQCVRTPYDDAVYMSRSVTDGCDAVLYTVALGDDLTAIPSANVAVAPDSVPKAEEKGRARCNVAFVSEGSPLARRLKVEMGLKLGLPVAEKFYQWVEEGKEWRELSSLLLQHGHWTLIPVVTALGRKGGVEAESALRLLPKLSPGSFFSARTKHAIYADPDVTFHSVPDVLRQARMQPHREGMEGITAMMVGDGLADGERRRSGAVNIAHVSFAKSAASSQAEALQQRAYNMIRVGLRGEMHGGGTHPIPDASWAVHALGAEDARLFRCDAYGEVLQWEASEDERAMEFVMGLHDMWSRVIVRWGGLEPWWTGEDGNSVEVGPARGLKEQSAGGVEVGQRRLTDLVGFSGLETSVSSENEDGVDAMDVAPDESAVEYDTSSLWDQVSETSHGHRRLEETIVRVEDKKNASGPSKVGEGTNIGKGDSWMGVLSSTETHYFVRIVPSSAIGVVHLDDYDI